ncbi:MAG TPA: HEAT repeat domain-containing protein [Gemmatimonadales bacterium]|nr:HEAT repeat domain-containing protein [Gemmatimonadales bacterium]
MRYRPLMILLLAAAPLAAQPRPLPAPAARPAPRPPSAAAVEREARVLEEMLAAEAFAWAPALADLDANHWMVEAELAATTGAMAARAAEAEWQASEMLRAQLPLEPMVWPGEVSFRSTAGGLASLRPARGTQEDSLYRVAREALNRGEYLRAAQLFQDYQSRFPTARTAPAALYWRAFALYRAGSDVNLRAALASLESQRTRYPATAEDSDAASLRIRINAALAARGDQQAAAAVRAANIQGTSCDREEMEVRAEALNALVRQDEAGAGTILNRVLAQHDECSVTLRRRAVYHLGRRSESDVSTLLLQVARTDPDRTVRADAIAILGRVPGDQTIRHLEQLFTSSTDERTRAAVFAALRNHDSPESNRLLRRYIGDTSLSDAMRASAISTLMGGGTMIYAPSGQFELALRAQEEAFAHSMERISVGGREAVIYRAPTPVTPATPVAPVAPSPRGAVSIASGGTVAYASVSSRRAPTEEDAAFLRGLYPRETSRAVKDAIITGLARMGGEANERWLMGVARDNNEDTRHRSSALSRMRSAGFPVADLVNLYDVVSDRSLRASIINTLGSREEDAATDKLFAIARSGTDPALRRQAITALSRKNDPRTTRLLLELIER